MASLLNNILPSTSASQSGTGTSTPASLPELAPLTSKNLYLQPLPPQHTPQPGKENFGRYILSIPWNNVMGWGQARIEPRHDITVDPLSGVMQYAGTCFEGMKCYKTEQGDLRLFRPEKNFDRFKRSAARLGLPCEWDNNELVSLLAKLVSLETPLVPQYDGGNLYIRPTLIETGEAYGIKESPYASAALLYIVTTVNLGKGLYPSAEAEGKGIKLDACKEFIRAWPGGTGSYKLGANYGTVTIAKKPGFAMSLWLHNDGKEDFISEAGAMNVFMIKQAADGVLEFITMSLENGIVLPGVTRDSIIELIRKHGAGEKDFPLDGMPKNVRVVERDISMAEITSSLADGTLKGMFGCGTGVVVVSIGQIQYEGQMYTIPHNPLVLLLRDTITGIQRGKIEHEWSYKVPSWKGVRAEGLASGKGNDEAPEDLAA